MEYSEQYPDVKNLPSRTKYRLNRIIMGSGYTYEHYLHDWCKKQMVDYAIKNKGLGLPETDPIMELYSNLNMTRDDSKEAKTY